MYCILNLGVQFIHMKEKRHPDVGPLCGRVFVLALVLAVASAVASTWYAWGLTWLLDYELGTIPILHCPAFILNPGDAVIDGPRCVVRINYSMVNYMAVAHKGNLDYCEVDPQSKIDCRMESTCEEALFETTEDGLMCEANFPTNTVKFLCSEVKPVPFCDSEFRVTPGNMVAIRGLFAGSILVAVIWVIAELVLFSVDANFMAEAISGRLRQKTLLPASRAELRKALERRWEEEREFLHKHGRFLASDEFCSTVSGPAGVGRTGPLSDVDDARWDAALGGSGTGLRRTPISSRDPARRFACGAWRRKVENWRSLRTGSSRVFRPRQFARTLSLIIFFQIMLIVSMYLIILGSPRNLVNRGDFVDVLYGAVSIWNIHSWLDLLIFTDVLLDFGLFMCACLAVSWPSEPVFASHLRLRLEKLALAPPSFSPAPAGVREEAGSLDTLPVTESSSGGSLVSILNQTLTQDVCLLIACHQSCLTEEKEATFRGTILAALRVFPPKHVFVCDNGNALAPTDHTEFVVKSIHEEINYLYIPEGNKTFAFYWTNQYWIPYLEKCGKLGGVKFRYALIIDDDVPLPANMHIPLEHLRKNPEIKAVHFAITAVDGNHNPNEESGARQPDKRLLAEFQDIEYKLSGVHKYFQSYMSRAMSCHGAVALWERQALSTVLFEHDTVFNGEDMVMGLALLRKRDNSRIISCPQTIVPTYCPSSWGVLFRQRVKSWELTSHKKTFTYLVELLSPESFIHISSLVLKPYFLQELLAIILDWLRIYLLLGLVCRDWLALTLMTVCFMSVLYLQMALFQYVYLRRRRDLRASFKAALLFPFYKLTSLVFRICALCQNILVYSHLRKGIYIKTREDEIKDIPPLPPHSDPDWSTVWCIGAE